MEGNLYNHIKLKNLKRDRFLDTNEEIQSLLNFSLQSSFSEMDDQLIIKALCFDLKIILNLADLREIISAIFKLENQIFTIKEKWNFEESLLPSLDDFYKSLSPMLLRAVWEYNESYSKESELNKKLMESLRVSLEEELYFWQEQIQILNKPIL